MNIEKRDVLKKQLELVRFERAIDYITGSAGSQKRLNSQELAHLNNMMTSSTDNPWRQNATSIQLPFGRQEKLSLINNPMFAVRDILSNAFQQASNGEIEDAATYIYTQLVLNHFFNDANRRTAVAATYWLLLDHGIEIPAIGLLELGLGDIRTPQQVETLRGLIKNTIEIAKNRR